MLYVKPDVYIATYDSGSLDLIQVYAETGEMRRSFQEKKSLHSLRYDIHKGLSADGVRRGSSSKAFSVPTGKSFIISAGALVIS